MAKPDNPKIFSINCASSFVDTLVEGVVSRFGRDPLVLSSATILVPNRRAVRAVRDAFLRRFGNRPMLLPALRAIGDIDEGELEFLGAGFGLDLSSVEPAMSGLRRQILLCRLVERWQLPHEKRAKLAPAQAWRLAGELAALIDQVDTAGLSFDALQHLAPEKLALHWHETLEFLKIVTEHWPTILKAEQAQNPAAFRNQSLVRLSEFYQKSSPKTPIIAAGSTGSIPATAQLLGVIARLPCGSVILPGFDTLMSDSEWDALDETHPQSGMKRLLNTIGVSRFEVDEWADTAVSVDAVHHRMTLLRRALLPAKETEKWRDFDLKDGTEADLYQGLRSIVAPTRREEATAIALALRESLETPGKTAALVTTDRQLALHVRAALGRWGVHIDDSGGDKAIHSMPGRLLALVAAAASDRFGPLSFLCVLQHPLVSAGMPRGEFLRLVRQIDRCVLRGVRPAGGLAGLLARTEALSRDTKGLINARELKDFKHLVKIFEPLETALSKPIPLSDLLTLHVKTAETLCDEPALPGARKIWVGDAGSALSDHLAAVIENAEGLEVPSAESYDAYFAEIMSPVTVRPNWNRHPRLAIWGPMEARLQQADLMILGSLNEGTWPAEQSVDPWMSRAMRTEFGLPPLERRVGQSAHDFLMAASAPEVLLTRSEKIDGTPTVPSRWWFRIEALSGRAIPRADKYVQWAGQLDAPGQVKPVSAPEPKPPLAARPSKLSVTQVQELMRDPYALYAKKILNLAPLDALDEKPNAAQKGTLLHDALELFLKEPGPQTGPGGIARLLEVGRRTFEPVITQPAVYAFWWPRFERIASWFVENEGRHRTHYETVVVEGWARHSVRYASDMPEFTLIAKADRIDRHRTTGKLLIIDYKTGETPTAKQIEAGYAPQLPLEAWLASVGAFDGLDAGTADDLVFWKLSGGDPVQEQKRPIKDIEATVEQAALGLRKLITAFNNPASAYLSNPRPTITGYGEYDHLARVKEWRNSIDPLSGLGDELGDVLR